MNTAEPTSDLLTTMARPSGVGGAHVDPLGSAPRVVRMAI